MSRRVLQQVLGLFVVWGLTVVAAEPNAKEKKDAFDKAGNATENALDTAGGATKKGMTKAGEGTEKGLEATGKGVGAAVEHTGRATVTAGKATAKAMEATADAVSGVFTGKDDPDYRSADKVKDAQRVLQQKGYYRGPIDGIAGPKTRSGLREFQGDAGVEVTGRLDQPTAEKLGID